MYEEQTAMRREVLMFSVDSWARMIPKIQVAVAAVKTTMKAKMA